MSVAIQNNTNVFVKNIQSSSSMNERELFLEPSSSAASASSSSISEQQNQVDELLHETNERYVMFPLKNEAIWKMYKKQVDCFWRAEEVDL